MPDPNSQLSLVEAAHRLAHHPVAGPSQDRWTLVCPGAARDLAAARLVEVTGVFLRLTPAGVAGLRNLGIALPPLTQQVIAMGGLPERGRYATAWLNPDTPTRVKVARPKPPAQPNLFPRCRRRRGTPAQHKEKRA